MPLPLTDIPRPLNRIAILFLLLPLLACAGGQQTVPSEPPLPDSEAGQIVASAIDFAGGWGEWKSKKSVDYLKRTINFDEDGNQVSDTTQHHRYLLHPQFMARVEWEQDGQQIVLINNGQQTWKVVDGQVASSQSDRDQAWNSTFGSHYVFCMPFKLADPGTQLAYAGERTLPGGESSRRIDITYAEGAGSAAGMHFWSYYFSAEDGRLLANHLRYGPDPDQNTFSIYGNVREIEGLRLATLRHGYASTPEREVLHKTSEISYSDVRFDTVTDPQLFQPPQ